MLPGPPSAHPAALAALAVAIAAVIVAAAALLLFLLLPLRLLLAGGSQQRCQLGGHLVKGNRQVVVGRQAQLLRVGSRKAGVGARAGTAFARGGGQ